MEHDKERKDFDTAGAASGPSGVAKLMQEPAETVLDMLPARSWSAEHVHLFFNQKLGAPDESFDAMLKMDLSELEDLQGVADKISKGSDSGEAQKVALEWSVRIANVIA